MTDDNVFNTRSGSVIPAAWIADSFSKLENRRELMQKVSKLNDHSVGFGIWLIQEQKGTVKISIYRQGLIDLLSGLGFYKLSNGVDYCFVREHQGFIEQIDPQHIGHFVYELITSMGGFDTAKEFSQVYDFTLNNLQETWLRQFESTIKASVLSYMDTYPKSILKDSEGVKYLPFRNLLIKVTKASVESFNYISDNPEFGIWKSQLIDHDIQIGQDLGLQSMFRDFVWNISSSENGRFNSFQSALGYLCHNYQTSTQNQAIICVDEAITTLDKPEGGTGKGLFIQAIKQLCNLVTVDGKAFLSNNRFAFQDVQLDTQVIAIEDIKKKFDFDRLNSALTEGLSIEKKNRDSYKFSKDHSPKIAITSNVMVESAGNTRKRRQFILEFSDYLKHVPKEKLADPILHLYDCAGFFTKAWDKNQWNCFYNFMIDCIQFYLRVGLQPYEHKNLKRNQLSQGTCEEFTEWLTQHELEVGNEYETKELYLNFLDVSEIDKEEVKQRRFTSWIKTYAELYELVYSNKSTNSRTFFVLKNKQQ